MFLSFRISGILYKIKGTFWPTIMRVCQFQIGLASWFVRGLWIMAICLRYRCSSPYFIDYIQATSSCFRLMTLDPSSLWRLATNWRVMLFWRWCAIGVWCVLSLIRIFVVEFGIVLGNIVDMWSIFIQFYDWFLGGHYFFSLFYVGLMTPKPIDVLFFFVDWLDWCVFGLFSIKDFDIQSVLMLFSIRVDLAEVFLFRFDVICY